MVHDAQSEGKDAGSGSKSRALVGRTLIVTVGALLILLVLTVLHAFLPRLTGADRSVQMAVHERTSDPATAVMLLFTSAGAIATCFPAVIAVIGWLLYARRRHEAMVLGLAMAGALLLNETLKVHFHRLRPAVPWSIGDEHTFSFPSGHAFFATTLYGTLTYLAARRSVSILVPAVALPLAIGLSRIYLGMHYPSDVVGGWLAGVVWVGTVVAAARYPSPRT